MCVKLPPGDLNPGPCPPHPTSTYTCGVTIAPRVCGGNSNGLTCENPLTFSNSGSSTVVLTVHGLSCNDRLLRLKELL